MIRPKLLLLLLLIPAWTFVGCSKHKDEINKLLLPFRAESAHFQFYFDTLDSATLKAIETNLEDNYYLVLAHFQPGGLPKIRVAVWSDKEAFYEAQNNEYPGSTGYVNGKEEIRVLRVGNNTPTIALHEFVHAVTLFLSEGFANNPRWLWESVAVYEAGQLVDPKKLSYMVDGDYATFEAMGTDQRIYEVGYTIAEFIKQQWGYEGMRRLINAHGDIQRTFGITPQAFQQQWYEYVKTQYL